MIKLVSEVQAEIEKEAKQTQSKTLMSSREFPTPLYHTAIYPNLYKEEKWFRFFSSKLVNNILSLFTRDKIIYSFLDDVFPASKVLQMGVSFGDEIQIVADQVGVRGRLDVIDISNTQLTYAQEALGDNYPQVNFYSFNAEDKLPEKYDTIICYMLLHELPIVSKTKVVNTALNSINEGGKVIFVDYGRPHFLHPLAYFVRMFNRLYQPFAERLWDREIASYAERDLDYNWQKQKFLGGLYQRVIVTRKEKDQIIY